MREASGVSANLRSLPGGGGGVSPLGDRFQPDLVKGTGNYQIPLHFPQGPNELRPGIRLTYSTGFGNGPFGLGWGLNPLRIERRTDRGVPTYDASDRFVLAGGALLIDVGSGRYRPEADTAGWLIQRIDEHWEIRDGAGRSMILGRSPAARESTPDGVAFAWCLEEEIDAVGNSVIYSWSEDGNVRYLDEIRYSIFTIRVVYEARPDIIRSGRSGFLRTTRLRARAIELHCDRLAPTLMRTYELSYTSAHNLSSLLSSVLLVAEQDGQRASMPELTFSYTGLDTDEWTISEPTCDIQPPSIVDRGTQFVDLNDDGLPDILQMTGGRAFRWDNLGEGHFGGPILMDELPSTVSLEQGNVAFADLNGNGRVDLFAVDQPLQVAFQANGRGGFEPDPIVFSSRPSVGLAEPETRLLDADGDGVVDVYATDRFHHLRFRHNPRTGFESPIATRRIGDLAVFPDVSFADRGVTVADMTGDGLSDIVDLQSGFVTYWPNLGHGSWGPRIVMANSPELPAGYRDERLHLIDVDGSGCADVVYVDEARLLIWFNQMGNGFAPPVELPIGITGDGAILPVDVYGDGRPALVWDAPPSDASSAGMLALRFNPGVAPYLMAAVDNGMGGRFEMTYSTSSAMRLLDRAEGVEWTGELPIVVQVLDAIIELDAVTNRRSERHIRYHDGVYDGPQRDFRGFRTVTVDTPGDASFPASRQQVTHFVGEPNHVDLAERDRQRALVGAVEAMSTFTDRAGDWRLVTSARQTWDVRVEHDTAAGRVYFPHLLRIETLELGNDDPDLIDVVEYADYDSFGNPRLRVRQSRRADEPAAGGIRSEERWTYVDNEAEWLVKLPARMEYRDGDGIPHAVQIRHYDGDPHVGLAEGDASAGLATRVLELRLLDAKLPAGFAANHNLDDLGYVRAGENDTAGWYSTTYSVARDARGNVTVHRSPLGDDVVIQYDADGLYPLGTTDTLNNATTTTFEPRAGEPREMVFPDGRRVVQDFDPLGRLIATHESDENGTLQMTRCWFFDGATPLSLTSIAPAAAGRQRADFTGVDLATVDGASVSRVYYDGFGQQTVQIARAPDGPAGQRRFATTGQVGINPRCLASVQYPPAFVADLAFLPAPGAPTPSSQRYVFDHEGQIASMLGPGGEHFRTDRDTVTTFQYDGADAGPFPADAADIRPAPPGPPRRIERFDARGRNISVSERAGAAQTITTTFELTVDGQIQTVSDGLGVIARYLFAGPGQPISISHRDVGTRIYLYDAAGRLVERIESDGTRTLFTNDSLGRLVSIGHDREDGTPLRTIRTVHFDSDPQQPDAGRFLRGRIARIEEDDVSIAFSYTPGGKPSREEYTIAGETLATERAYDLQGNVTRIEYPDGVRIDYRLDDSGSITEIPGFVSDVEYDARGVVNRYRLGNGVEVDQSRDPVTNRLGQISATRGGATLRRLTYGFDQLGAIESILDATGADTELQSFTYDGLYRLTSFERRDGGPAGAIRQSGTYEVDETGSLRRLEETEPLAFAHADPLQPGRVTSVTAPGGASAVLYDRRGNIRRFGQLAAIEYDPLDRATRFVKADGLEVRLRFDHQNRRLLKEVDAGGVVNQVRYVTGLYEQHAGHQLRHVYFGMQLVATERVEAGATSRLYYLSDHQGTLLCATDEAGAVVSNERMSPFGAPWSANGDQLNRFLGRVADEETGLVHLGARFYSPHLGRFTSVDWYMLERPDKAAVLPQSFNVYAYGLNNPLAFKDPSGLFIFIVAGVIAAIAITAIVATAVAFTVGFVAGLVYGLTHDQGWGSLLTALETGLLTTAGMWLGAATGFLVGGPVGAIIGGAMGGMNGLISGMHGIYDWGSWKGWAAFLSDSTWGLLGTSLGNMVHIVNIFWPDSNYRHDLSHRQNRHVYEGGFRLKKGFAFTQGNVISNAGQGGKGINASFISNHEELHIWQSRLFGPLYQVTYVVWGLGGLIVGTIVWLTDTDQSWGSLVETAAYYDNPFEYWAYKNDNNWPPAKANKDLTW
jgi:RHS repeat-associated protein